MEQRINIELAEFGLEALKRALSDAQLSCAFWRVKNIVDAIEIIEKALGINQENLSSRDKKIEKLTSTESISIENLLERKVL